MLPLNAEVSSAPTLRSNVSSHLRGYEAGCERRLLAEGRLRPKAFKGNCQIELELMQWPHGLIDDFEPMGLSLPARDYHPPRLALLSVQSELSQRQLPSH